MRKAIQYDLDHWDALTRFLHDPKVKLDNNIAERDLRKLALWCRSQTRARTRL